MRSTICLIILLFSSTVKAQEVYIIPKPVSLKQPAIAASFTISPATLIVLEGSNLNNAVTFFNDYLQKNYLFKLKVVKNSVSKNSIRLNYEMMENEMTGAYNMTIDAKGVYIAGDNEEGVFYGIQSLIQLLPHQKPANKKLSVPYLSIKDTPRFAYRGLHFDVSRHFYPVDYIKKYIDYIALHKMNYFHWHLTDDQGWRIEIKKYPKLTSVGAWRDGTIIGRYPGTGNDHIHYGGFYTQEQIKEVVKYAADRYITVIPEIEMPGHSMAALAAYPQLGTTPDSVYKVSQTWGINGMFNNVLNPSEYTFNFLEDVLDEVMTLFPSPYIHIGGDECDKQWWKKSSFCQQLMKEKGIKDEEGLQSYFIQRMEKYINSKGRKIIGWDEILEGGLAPNAVVMSWRGEQGGIDAAKQNHDVIMTPGNPVYFDHTQSQNEDSVTIGGYNPIENVYAYEPIPKELNAEQAKHVLGAQANMWTEYMKNTRKVEYMLFPRLSALSEVLWSKKENRDWKDFEKRLLGQFKRYDLWKVNYSKAYFDLKSSISPDEKNMGLLWNYSSKSKNISYRIAYKAKAEFRDTIPIYSSSDPSHVLKYSVIRPGDTIDINRQIIPDTGVYQIRQSGTYTIYAYRLVVRDHHHVPERNPFTSITQAFHFNKATGKKITLTNPASEKYPGDGAFTLVNGVINEKGFARSREFLGFNGTDCEAIIDLWSSQLISFVVVNTLHRKSSWIWRPLTAEVFGSSDGQKWYSLKLTDDFEENKDGTGKGKMMMSFKATYAQFIKVVVTNWGTIPDSNPGAGNKPWLFVDEIEVDGPTESELK